MLPMKRKVVAVRNLEQARAYILQVGICGIFSDAKLGMPNLWDVVDLPDRQPGEKALDPQTTGSLREELNATLRPERTRFDRALQELQITLNIARRNSLEDTNDTWVLFSDQYYVIYNQ
jgi:hypothetical protein